MPVAVSYPGVYVEEIPSGVRTITGVATSIAAFVGRALRGPTDEPVFINSYADFERVFGGLWTGSTLGYAVRDFYLNGGSQAIIVRLYQAKSGETSETPLSVGNFKFKVAYSGYWGSNVRFAIDGNVSDQVAAALHLAATDLFNLTIYEVNGAGGRVRTEVFRNLTVANSSRRIDKILSEQSNLLRWQGDWPTAALPDVKAIHDAEAEVAKAQQALDAKLKNASSQADIDAARKALAEKQDALMDLSTDNISKAERDVSAANRALAAALSATTPVPPEITAAAKNAADALTKAKSTSDGDLLTRENFSPDHGAADKKGLYALEDADLFNMLCIPPYLIDGNIDPALVSEAAAYCEKRRAMLIVDPRKEWDDKEDAKSNVANIGTNSKNAALFFPRLHQPDPLQGGLIGDFAPCGAIAGVFARTDATRGVWKAPAGLDATLVGVPELTVKLTDGENGELNPLGINCLRTMPAAGRIVWGSRTLQGDDRLASEWKYIPVRRTALYIEESLYRGTQWVVFEPNDEPLWAQIRLNVGAFMHSLFRKGAFQGTTPKDAYFVKCDKDTTTQNDINLGVVNIAVGFAPLKPAEFVIIQLQQMAGQIQS